MKQAAETSRTDRDQAAAIPPMRALRFDGTAARLATSHPRPEPQQGEALIRTRRAAVSAIDVELCRGLFEFQGSTKNNVVLTGEWWATCGTILKENEEGDPARRYKLLYTDIFGVEDPNAIPTPETAKQLRSGVCIAYSPDGVHWTPHDGNPVIEGESPGGFSPEPNRSSGGAQSNNARACQAWPVATNVTCDREQKPRRL